MCEDTLSVDSSHKIFKLSAQLIWTWKNWNKTEIKQCENCYITVFLQPKNAPAVKRFSCFSQWQSLYQLFARQANGRARNVKFADTGCKCLKQQSFTAVVERFVLAETKWFCNCFISVMFRFYFICRNSFTTSFQQRHLHGHTRFSLLSSTPYFPHHSRPFFCSLPEVPRRDSIPPFQSFQLWRLDLLSIQKSLGDNQCCYYWNSL